MPGDITESLGPDWGAIEGGDLKAIANTMWLLFAMITQESQRRSQALQSRAPNIRQDRVAMMGVYAS